MPRPCPRTTGVAFVLVGACALSVLAPTVGDGAAAQTLDDLDDAREVVEGAEDELDAVTAEYERTWADIESLRVEIDDLERRAATLQAEADVATRMLADRARAAFKRGTNTTVETLIASEGSRATVERAGLLAALQLRDQVDLERALAGRVALAQTVELIEERERQLAALQADLEATAAVLQADLEQAQAEVDELATLVARQRRIDRGAQQGIYSCIFDSGAFRFRDTWGAPRSGGRRHKGTDVFAAYGAPVYAVTSGVVERHSSGGLGGIGLYLRGQDGNLYYYAHLDSIEPHAGVGVRVTAGELVARNGSSGNADRWAPHVHFELRPGGGGQINPYPWLAAACL